LVHVILTSARQAKCVMIPKTNQHDKAKRDNVERPEITSLGMRNDKNRLQPMVVVVTPVYNGDAYLRATMECVQNQTYANIVHVVLDNCSTDRTSQIIEQFRNGHIKVITARNAEVLPMYENWNSALRLVPKEAVYVKILCADDLMRRDCISKFVAIAETDEKIETVFSHDVVYEKVRRANLSRESAVFDGLAIARASMNESINWLPYHHLFIRWHHEDSGRAMFEAMPIFFDYVAVFRRLCRGKCAYLHEALVYTRCHKDSETSRQIEAIPLLNKFDIFTSHGRDCWDEAGYAKELAREKERLARKIMQQTLKGHFAVARHFKKTLRERGIPVGPFDYLKSALRWPAYMRWKRSWRQLDGPEIDEAKFLAE